MKATGIVRRIDDLGRVVIPKEIRRTMRIREGEPLEIYTDRDGEVIFKKYSPVGELSSFATACAEGLAKVANLPVIVCDRDLVIVAVGLPKKEYEGKEITGKYEELMEDRQGVFRTKGAKMPLIIEDAKMHILAAAPVVSGGDVIGSVALLGEERVATEVEYKLCLNSAAFLSKQVENV